MAATDWILSSFHEAFDKWETTDYTEIPTRFRQYKWDLERYVKTQDGASVPGGRFSIGYVGDVSEIDCNFNGVK